MGENKKYYWLKLKDSFFRDKEIKKLRKIAGGDTYTIIYLKLQLLSLRKEGRLKFDNLEDTFSDEMALEIDEETENVKITLLYLQKCGLLEEINGNEYMLPQTISSIGSETQGAERIRRYRSKKALHCTPNVQISNTSITNSNTERREKREELEKELELKEEIDKIPYKEIIDYLNLKATTKYRATGTKTKDIIKARYKEQFTLEDFKQVIDNKCSEWLKTEWEKFLRPETLFSNKFEGYLNQKSAFTNNEVKIHKDFGSAY